MKIITTIICSFLASTSFAQEIIFPGSRPITIKEQEELAFSITTTDSIAPLRYSLEGNESLKIQFDSLGKFKWKPDYSLVNRLEQKKEITLIFQAEWNEGKRVRTALTFIVMHQNRPPEVDELPSFYVKMNASNQYQIGLEYVRDPDGDPIVFKAIPSQMPEGSQLTSSGLFTWAPSRNQFNALKDKPLEIEFVVQDQPEKAEKIGKIRIAQTQLDLPPEILLVPGDSLTIIKEDELLNIKLYISDPNGDENINITGFVSSDTRIPQNSLKNNTKVQSEFTWTPGYEFVEEVERQKEIELTFFAIDKSNKRVQKKIKVRVLDTENLDEKDKQLFIKYRASLVMAKNLIEVLDENHVQLNKAYKKAKKGKKNRSIANASLGAATGISPLVLEPDQSKYVSGIGGTAVLTMGTLEATEVIGKSKSDILEKLKVNVEIRNQLQLEGDNFARKYALKSARRGKDFDADRDKLLPIINNQKIVLLELDAQRSNRSDYSNKEIKKTFPDFSEE